MATTSTPGRCARASRWAEAAKLVPTMPTPIRERVGRASVTGGERDGEDDYDNTDDLLLDELKDHEDEPVVDQPDHQRPEENADDRRPAAEQARPAKDHGRDDRQLVALAPLEAPGLQAPGVEHAGDRRDSRRDHHHGELDAAGRHAAEARRLLVAARREHPAAVRGAAQEQVPDRDRHRGPDHERWDRAEVAGPEDVV